MNNYQKPASVLPEPNTNQPSIPEMLQGFSDEELSNFAADLARVVLEVTQEIQWRNATIKEQRHTFVH